MTNKLKVGIAGYGVVGKRRRIFIDQHPMLETVVVCDRIFSDEGIFDDGVRYYSDYQSLLKENLDLLFVCMPNDMAPEVTIAGLDQGLHVFCEKPLALTKESAERAIEACNAANIVLGVGHERRFEPAMVEIRRMVEAGELGKIMHVEANFSHDKLANLPANNWRVSSSESPAAGMTATGIHLTDAYLHIFGPIQEVYAVAQLIVY